MIASPGGKVKQQDTGSWHPHGGTPAPRLQAVRSGRPHGHAGRAAGSRATDFLRANRPYHPQQGCQSVPNSPQGILMPKVMIGPAPLARLQGDFLTVLRNAGFEFAYPKVAV